MGRPAGRPYRWTGLWLMTRILKAIFESLWTIVQGMRVTLGYFPRRAVTLQYPTERKALPRMHRGKLAYSIEKCIACRMCEQICPDQCIAIRTTGKGKSAKIDAYVVDHGLCCFCGLCVEVCPTDAIWMTQEYELAAYARESCVYDQDTMPPAMPSTGEEPWTG